MNDTKNQPSLSCPVPLVCPTCQAPLETKCERSDCPECVRNLKFTDGFPDLIVGQRFDDETDETCLCYEENSNADLTRSYWLPLFDRLWPQRNGEKPNILSLGCGTGIDVDLLSDEGFNSIGIEIGNRTKCWNRRRYPERFLLANGMHLPFEDGTFDCVYCGCVFPHVGVVGDTNIVSDRYHDDRMMLAREMARVLKPDGKIIVSSPNRWFLFDIFHGRKPGSYKPRWNPPTNPFLLSVADYGELFAEAGLTRAKSLPVAGYWGFVRSRKSLKGMLLGLPVRFVFWLTSCCSLVRGTMIDPWLVVQIDSPKTSHR